MRGSLWNMIPKSAPLVRLHCKHESILPTHYSILEL